jgi:excinuclease UvrABC helicase subunit UvrB
MGKTFDDLFNEFFNRRRSNPTSINDEIQKIIESLMSFQPTKVKTHDESVEAELGEPDEIIEHTEMGMNFKKLIWNTPEGRFVKIVVTDVEPFPPTPPPPDEDPLTVKRKKHSKSLEQRLKEAVEVEDYELAIELRDEIKKSRRKRKKKTD